MECDNCAKQRDSISRAAFEFALARDERNMRRLWILLIIVIVMLVGTNLGWLYYESQFEDEVYTQTVSQDSGDGGINTVGDFVGGDYYGETNDNEDG